MPPVARGGSAICEANFTYVSSRGTQREEASVDMMGADEFENQRRPNTIFVVITSSCFVRGNIYLYIIHFRTHSCC